MHGAQWPMRLYTPADGLAGDTANCIVQDSHGFIWFCTIDGLSRFDGYQFLNFGPAQGLRGAVNALLETSSGDFWVASSEGVYRFNPAASRKSSAFKLHRIGGFRVNDLAPDGPSGLWCGTNRGLYHLEQLGNGGHTSNADEWASRFVDIGMPTNTQGGSAVDALLLDRDGVLWVGSPSGLYRRPHAGRCDRYTARDGLYHDHVVSLLQDREGALWAGTWEGLCRISTKQNRADSLPKKIAIEKIGLKGQVIYSLLESSDSRIWVGAKLGLYELLSRDRRPQFAHRASTPVSMNEDHSGNSWRGLEGTGVVKLPKRGFATYTEKDGLAQADICSIVESRQGTLCVVTSPAHDTVRWINWFDGQRFHAVRPNIPQAKRSGWGWYQHMFEDHEGEWWVPTGQGIFRFASGSGIARLGWAQARALFKPGNPVGRGEVFRVYEDSRGDIWMGIMYDGPDRLTRWERATGNFRYYEQVRRDATAFAEDRSGDVWIGFSEGGLARYRRDHLEFFGAVQGVPEGWTQTLYLDSQGRLWRASANGVTLIDSPATDVPTFLTLTTDQGLSTNRTRSITEDRWGRIYVGGVSGIDSFYFRQPLHVRHYSRDDGLPAATNVAFRDRQGALWFGTIAGLARFEPQLDEPEPPAPVVISAVRVRGEPRNISAVGETELAGMVLRANQNQLQVEFVSPDFHSGTPVRYQYRLEPVDTDWSTPSRTRTVNFATLAAGDYRFMVRAVTFDGVVSTKPATLAFTILAPYWARWWFRTPAFFLLMATIYMLYRIRLARVLEVERLRTRIATDLHDDIGASLSRIAIMSEVLIQRAGAETNSLTSQLSEMAGNAREMVASMSDIVWAINPRHDHLRDLAQRMRRFASDVLSASHIDFVFQAPADQEIKLGADARRHLFLMFKETINNIVRHAGCMRAEIELKRDRDWIVLRIQDDGKGLGTATSASGHGLANMQTRAAAVGGDVAISSQPGQGTSVTFRLPATGRR
jgi:signal transduction histidine kinase/ligand-binding sensor domain-containing protein